jgi:preprotein translocase subunit SecE
MSKEAIIEYFKGVKSEWGKVTWPDRRQVIVQTVVVLGVVIAFSLYIYFIDIVLQGGISLLGLKA